MADASDVAIEFESRRGRVVLSTVVPGSAVAMSTATVVNVALPTSARSLDAGSADQKWIVDGYTLTLASFILIGGSLGDRYGRRGAARCGAGGTSGIRGRGRGEGRVASRLPRRR